MLAGVAQLEPSAAYYSDFEERHPMTPQEAPPGVTIKWLARPSGSAWNFWQIAHPAPETVMESRPIIKPRLILVHTNGASNQGTAAAAYNWAMAAPNNTKPHYQVDRDGSATKFLPSDRKGIGNGTEASATGGKMTADFSLVIETADLGWGAGKPGPTCGFTPEQSEMLSSIIAWECFLWKIPIAYPSAWDGAGVACHTEPCGYPYWTIDKGHVCPGTQKKIEVVQVVMPRAHQLLKQYQQPEPVPPPSGEEEMELYLWQDPRYANVFLLTTGTAFTIDGDVYADKAKTLKVYNKKPHDATLFSLMRKAGLKKADMVQTGGQSPATFPADLS
jgi:N-acetylmuramoyl-L-alanine amidase